MYFDRKRRLCVKFIAFKLNTLTKTASKIDKYASDMLKLFQETLN